MSQLSSRTCRLKAEYRAAKQIVRRRMVVNIIMSDGDQRHRVGPTQAGRWASLRHGLQPRRTTALKDTSPTAI